MAQGTVRVWVCVGVCTPTLNKVVRNEQRPAGSEK